MEHQFPFFDPWGKGSLQGRSNDTLQVENSGTIEQAHEGD